MTTIHDTFTFSIECKFDSIPVKQSTIFSSDEYTFAHQPKKCRISFKSFAYVSSYSILFCCTRINLIIRNTDEVDEVIRRKT